MTIAVQMRLEYTRLQYNGSTCPQWRSAQPRLQRDCMTPMHVPLNHGIEST